MSLNVDQQNKPLDLGGTPQQINVETRVVEVIRCRLVGAPDHRLDTEQRRDPHGQMRAVLEG
jgi:hypothetical protein